MLEHTLNKLENDVATIGDCELDSSNRETSEIRGVLHTVRKPRDDPSNVILNNAS